MALSGAFHSKGVRILEGFLRGRYLSGEPFSIAASITFEQSYALVDGDSASTAELAALLSALTEMPLRQDLAVTGALDQMGRVQPCLLYTSLGTAYIAQQLGRFGQSADPDWQRSVELAAAAYNGGPGTVLAMLAGKRLSLIHI